MTLGSLQQLSMGDIYIMQIFFLATPDYIWFFSH